MDSGSSDQQANSRPLTTAQRDRKRKVDKMKQRTKRAENKARLEDIERDVSFLRRAVSDLLGHLRDARPLSSVEDLAEGRMVAECDPGAGAADASSRGGFHAPAHQPVANPYTQPLPPPPYQHPYSVVRSSSGSGSASTLGSAPIKQEDAPAPYPSALVRRTAAPAWQSGQDGHRCACCGATCTTHVQASVRSHSGSAGYPFLTESVPLLQGDYSISRDFESNLSSNVRVHPYGNAPFVPPPPASPRLSPGSNASLRVVVDCRCGHPHDEQIQCIEYTGFSLLLGPGKPRADVKAALPRSPLLPEILLHSISGNNPLSAAIATVVRPYKVLSLATHVGWFFLAYRLLRWRLNPTPENFNDVPPNMRPTPAQERLPHPFSRDFLPWPALREHMNATQHADRRSTVQLFLESVVFDWPTGKELMCRNAYGEYDLHPDFETMVGDSRCWHLEAPYSRVFPELIQYAH